MKQTFALPILLATLLKCKAVSTNTNYLVTAASSRITYPYQFGAVGNGVVDLSHGIGNIQAAVVNGTDDAASLNAMFNSVSNGPSGSVIDGQNKWYFINSPVFVTNANGGPIQIQNFGFVSTNRNLVGITTGIGRMRWLNCTWVGTTNAVTSVGISNDWSYSGVISDYVVANTMTDCIWKGGFYKDVVIKHNTNPKFQRCIFANFSSNGVHSVLSDQVMFDCCIFGYTFDATGGSLTNELTGGGNTAWTNALSVCVDGGIVTTLKNCENNTSGTFLHAANTTIIFDGGDIEQCYMPTTTAACWLTNCILSCGNYVNFINNNSGISNNCTTWKLDNCNLSACVIHSAMLPVTTNPQIDIFGNTSGGHGFPYIVGQLNGMIVRQHASWANPSVAGSDFNLSLGNVVSSSEGNYYSGPQIYTNIVYLNSGLIGDYQVGANYGQRGTITPSFPSGHAWYMQFPNTTSSVPNISIMGARAFGSLTHLFLGGDVDNNPGVTDIIFSISPVDGTAAFPKMTLSDGGLTLRSNSLASIPSNLQPGDIHIYTSNGIAFRILVGPTGTRTTNTW